MNNKSFNAKNITMRYAAAFFVYFAAFCMIRSFISVYLLDRGFTYTQVGIITGFHMFFTAAIQPNYARILDRFPGLSLQRFLIICCGPAIICSVLTYILPSNLFLFLLLYIVFAFCEIGLQSLMVSVGMEYLNEGIPINAGLGRGAGSVGYAAANFILGMLIVKFGSQISQKLNIGLMLLLALLLFIMPDPQNLRSEDKDEKNTDKVPADDLISFMRNNRVFAMFSGSCIFLFFGHSIVNTYMPNVSAQFGLGTDFTGAVVGMAAFLELIPMMFYTQIIKRISVYQLLYISALFFTIKILTAALAQSAAGLIISQLMQILAYALFSMSSIYFANQAVRPHNRVLAQGLLLGALEAGFMIGGLVGGIVLDHFTIRSLLWMGVVSSAVGSLLMIISITKFRNFDKQ